jgi:23S rRNA-/tRNA-specific pseudouridylate synthase
MGDPKYAGDIEKKAGVLPIPRQMLHASTLVFTHPFTGNIPYAPKLRCPQISRPASKALN